MFRCHTFKIVNGKFRHLKFRDVFDRNSPVIGDGATDKHGVPPIINDFHIERILRFDPQREIGDIREQ